MKSKYVEAHVQLAASDHVDNWTFSAVRNTKVTIMRGKKLWVEKFITFNDDDLQGITQPHNDGLVIIVSISNFQIKSVLINSDSSANIIP